MTAVDDPVLAHLLADVDRANAALRAYVTGQPEAHEPSLVLLKEAATVWRIGEDAALRRAQRGLGIKRNGRWWIPRDKL